jgi:hypothetical protein
MWVILKLSVAESLIISSKLASELSIKWLWNYFIKKSKTYLEI